MRPLILSWAAFGPFPGEERIDFTDMEEHAVFLLTGVTGSGKTTVFDVLSFALFGEVSGQIRKSADKDDYRSHYADNKTETYVSLIFSEHGRRYDIRRVPAQRVVNPKTGRERNLPASVLLRDVTDAVPKVLADKKNTVTEEIERIIRMDYNQFRQIVMIAQGEFATILQGGVKDRKDILRQIFQTHVFDRVRRQLEERARGLDADIRQYGGRLAAVLDAVAEAGICSVEVVEPTEPAPAEMDALIEAVAAAETTATAEADAAGKTQEATAKALVAATEAEQTLRDECLARKNCEQSLADARTAAETAGKEHAAAAVAVAETAVSLPTMQKRRAAREDDLRRMEILRRQADYARQRTEMALACRAAETLVSERTAAVTACTAEVTANTAECHKIDGALTALESTLAQGMAIPDLATRAAADLSATKRLMQEVAAWARFPEILAEDLKTLQMAERTMADMDAALREKYERLIGHWLDRVAETLVAGTPCPVCGATDHPAPHQPSDADFDEADYKREKDAADACRGALSDRRAKLRERLERVHVGYEDLRRTVDEIRATQNVLVGDIVKLKAVEAVDDPPAKAVCRADGPACPDMPEPIGTDAMTLAADLNAMATCVSALTASAEALYASANHRQAYFATLTRCRTEAENRVGALRKDLRTATTDGEALARRLTTLRDGVAEAKAMLRETTAKLAMLEKESAGADERSLAEELAQLEERVVSEAAAVEAFMNRHHALEKALSAATARLKEKRADEEAARAAMARWRDAPSSEEMAHRLATYTAERGAAATAHEAAIARYRDRLHFSETVTTHRQRLAEAWQTYMDVCAEGQRITQLRNVASGRVAGSNRIDFETYVQLHYFEEVIKRANRRLEKMTYGQYRFVIDRTDKNAAASFFVFDSYTGRARSTKTLSGGETFKAALAMALGLSDTVSAYQGGIRIEMLFIDEGFGSLDAESLERAVETIQDLVQEDCMVGIISHVELLKELIERQVVVIKTEEGSYIEHKH
ncbi:MAG: SMC family ATPase [Eubacteriales bacterium]|nr:SMC family ATPase [Eubacteriales bacterium]